MPNDFLNLIEKVRNGDEAAVTTLVEQYGATIRRAIRMQMLDSRLQRVIGESDIFQSVISRFLFDLWAGRFDFESPQHLAALLKKMATSKVIDAARHHTAQRRDIRRNEGGPADESPLHVPQDATPSRIIAGREILQQAMECFSSQEQQILRWRQDGIGWDEIGQNIGKTSEAARKQYDRAVERVAERLNIGDSLAG